MLGVESAEVDAGDGVDQISAMEPTLITRAALVCAALLPWFAVFSGTYGLYFYALLLAAAGDTLGVGNLVFVALLALALPLAALLLFVMPAGAMYAAFRGPPGGWAGRLARAGCLVSMGFAAVYAALLATMGAAWFLQEGVDDAWGPFMLWRVAVLIFGTWATWWAWRGLRRHGSGRTAVRHGDRRASAYRMAVRGPQSLSFASRALRGSFPRRMHGKRLSVSLASP